MTLKLTVLVFALSALLRPVAAQTIETSSPPDVKIENARFVTENGKLEFRFDLTNLGKQAITAWDYELKATFSNGKFIHVGWADDCLVQYSYLQEHEMSRENGPLFPGTPRSFEREISDARESGVTVLKAEFSVGGLIFRDGTPIGERPAIDRILASRNLRLQEVEFALETIRKRRQNSADLIQAIGAAESDLRSIYPANAKKDRVDLERQGVVQRLQQIREQVRGEPAYSQNVVQDKVDRVVESLERERADLQLSTAHRRVQ